MKTNLIFLPVIVQISLTLALYIALAVSKNRAVMAGEVDESRRGLHDDAWPDYVLKINNCIRNQFEVPVLFYVLAISFWALNAVDIYVLIAAWLFVFSRVAHAYVHTGSNYVPLRRRIFLFGCLIIAVMLVLAAKSII